MPCDYSKYPLNWRTEIAPRILKRDGNCCKFCGIENGSKTASGKRVVLTVAHLDNPDPMDCRDVNLAALCQKCHNQMDAPMRAAHSKETRARKKRESALNAGQGELFK